MTIDRDTLVDLLGAYASDALDAETRDAVERALLDHPDLEDEVDRLHSALAPLGHLTSEPPSSDLGDRMLDRALARRVPGRTTDAAPNATAPETYRVIVEELRSLLADVSGDESASVTPYGTSVATLVAHLAAGEQMIGHLLGLWPVDPNWSGGHLTLGGPGHGATMSAATALWSERAEATVRRAAALEARELGTRVTMHGIEMTVAEMLVVRAFETWSHTEDIRRATGRPLPPIPEPVVHTMATQAIDMLSVALSIVPDNRDKTFRVTLTGVGSGSWPRRVGGGTIEPAEQADATLVADAIEFCRLFADRVDRDGLSATTIGDDALCDQLITIAPTFADFGERVDD